MFVGITIEYYLIAHSLDKLVCYILYVLLRRVWGKLKEILIGWNGAYRFQFIIIDEVCDTNTVHFCVALVNLF